MRTVSPLGSTRFVTGGMSAARAARHGKVSAAAATNVSIDFALGNPIPDVLSNPIRAGIVGYGFAGRGFHAYLIAQEPRIRLSAVASRDAGRRERAEADYGVATFETLAEML